MRRFAPLVLIALLGTAVSAQDDGEVRALARKGASLYDLGKYPEALGAFEAAYEKKPVPGLLFNIAQCHRQMGHLDQAARVYKSYLRTDPPEAAAKQARELLAKVEEALAKQASAVQAPPHDLTDSSAKKAAPDVAVLPAPAPPPAPVQRQRQRWPMYAAGGVAVSALALGVVWGLGSRSATNELSQLHQSGPVDPAKDAALRDEASSKYNRSRISYVVAGLAAATAVAFYFAF